MIVPAIHLITFLLILQIPDLTSVEPQVATKIERLHSNVLKKPQSAEAWGKLAMNLHAHDFQQESIVCYRKAASLDKNEFRWPYYGAIALQEIGSPEALLWFEESLKRKPAYAPLRLRYADALLISGKSNESAREFQEVLNLKSDSAEAYLGLAKISFASGQISESQANLLKAIRLNSNLAEAHALLAQIYRQKEDRQQADNELMLSLNAQKQIPADPELNDFLMEGVSSYWYELRGQAFLQKGEYEAAIKELEQAVKVLPDPRFYDSIGIAYQHLKKYREAAEQHRAALALDPNSAGTMNNLAAALVQIGRLPEAIVYLQKAITRQPDFSYSYNHLAGLHLRNNDPGNAIAALRAGYKRLPDNFRIALDLAWLLATTRHHNFQNGPEALNLALAVCARQHYAAPEGLDVLAAAYARTGNYEKAVQFATKAEQLASTDDFRRRIRSRLNRYHKKQPYEE